MSDPAVDWDDLAARAAAVAEHSYSPYSSFPVGAAGLLRSGAIHAATNVENASFVAGICAETSLVGMVVADGARPGDLVAVSVTDPAGTDLAPCGRCRQLLHEMGGPDLLVNRVPISVLLPGAFGPRDLR